LKQFRMRSRGVLVVAVVLVALALLLGGCGKSSNQGSSGTGSTGGTPKAGGVYNFPLDGEPVGIAPVTYSESIGYNIVHQVFEGLFKYQMDSHGNETTVNNICDSYTMSPDAKVFTFKIKHGVMFQPPVNREVKASDIVADWNFVTNKTNWVPTTPAYIMEPIAGTDATGYAKHGLAIKALDDYTLQVTLKYPFADFPTTLGHPIASIWPVDYAMKIGTKAYNVKPVGTGPFMVQDWVHNQYVDLVKNPNWWQHTATSGPWVDSVHLPIFGEPQTEWLAFQKGDIDFTLVPTGQVASSEQMAAQKGWITNKFPMLGVYYICFNMKSPVVGGAANLPLRQALSYATDRAPVIDTVSEGVPLVPTGVVPAGIPGSELTQLAYPTDSAKAKSIVAGLGTLPTLQLWYNTGSNHDQILAPVQAAWKAVGINTQMKGIDWATYLTQISQGNQDQIFRLGWVADYPSIDNFLWPLFQSGVSGVNLCTFYKNPTVDQLLSQARGTTDATQRMNLYIQAEKLILADASVIPLYDYRNYRIMNTRVANQTYDVFGSGDFWTVWVK